MFVISDHYADGAVCAGNAADGTEAVGAGFKQRTELASESSVGTEAARMQEHYAIFSSNSPQIASSPRSDTEHLPETENHSRTLPLTVSGEVQMDTVSQVISVQGPSTSEVPELTNSGDVTKPNVPFSTVINVRIKGYFRQVFAESDEEQ